MTRSGQDKGDERELTKWSVSRRAILTTGAIASGTLAVGEAVGRSAQIRAENARFPEGTRVVDGADPDPDPAIVINTLDVPISDWVVFGEETVADQNPTHDPLDRVVIVAFERLLDDGWPAWRRTPPKRLFDGVLERSIKFHAFPQNRLERWRSTGKNDG